MRRYRRLDAKLGEGNEDLIIAAFVIAGLLMSCLVCALVIFMCLGRLDVTNWSGSSGPAVKPSEFRERAADQDDELDKIKRRLKAKGRGRQLPDPEELDKQMMMSQRERTISMRHPSLSEG